MGSSELWARIDGGGAFPTGGPAAWHEQRRGVRVGRQRGRRSGGGVGHLTPGGGENRWRRQINGDDQWWGGTLFQQRGEEEDE